MTRSSRPHLVNAAQTALAVAVFTLAASCSTPVALRGQSARQYINIAPTTGGAPVLTGYQFDLLPQAEASECATPGTRYEVAVVGMEGEPSLGELAAAHKILSTTEGADLLLVSRSSGTTEPNGRSCGKVVGRPVRLRTADFGKETK